MSAVTKMPRTEKRKDRGPYDKSNSVPWREAFKEDLEKHGEVGVYLRGLRRRERLTQQQLAKKLGQGVSQHHISEMENGKRKITIEMSKATFWVCYVSVFLKSR